MMQQEKLKVSYYHLENIIRKKYLGNQPNNIQIMLFEQDNILVPLDVIYHVVRSIQHSMEEEYNSKELINNNFIKYYGTNSERIGCTESSLYL